MKIWRKVSAADKVPFLQKAKDNRAAQRINKAQKQAESQVCRPIKTEPGRIKGQRPNLHLQIPPASGSLSTPSQPSSAESPYPLAPDSASSAFFTDGPLKTPCSADAQTDPFSKLPSQSPHLQSQPSTPYSQPSSSPLPASSSGYPLPGPQGATQGRPASFGSLDMQPGTPSRAQQVDPFFKPQQQIPKPQQPSQEALGPPESPRPRPGGPGDSQMFSPLHTTHCGDPYHGQHGASRQDHVSSPSPSAIASSPAGVGPNRAEMNAPSPRSFGRQDLSSGSPASLDSGDGLFKAPMTPRMHQGDAGGLSVSHPSGASPNHPPETYRQSPSTFSDPYAQAPLTPRPQSGDGSSPLPQRLPAPQQEAYSRLPSSPQSQGSSHSPLTPGTISNDVLSVQSPATPRFQSPDPYSRPPSRPQSRDSFASLHKPPRPSSVAPEGNSPFRGSPHPSQQPPCSPTVADPLSGKPPFNCSPGVGLQMGQQQVVGQQQMMTPQQAQVHLPQPQSQTQPVGAEFNSRIALPPGNQDTAVRATDAPHLPNLPGVQDMSDLSSGQDPALMNLSPSELEKHRQRQRLREFLIRQKMQRNSLRQEKEAPVVGNPGQSWPGGEMPAFQQDKSQRAPPPYPQDRAVVAQAALATRMPLPVGAMDEKLCRPPPSGTPATMDPSALRQAGPNISQGMYPRPPFPAQWQNQGAPRRFPQPSMMEAVPRQHLNTPINNPLNVQSMPNMPNPLTGVPGTGTETVQSHVSGAPPQFIELRHNSQRMPLGPQYMQRAPIPRPRMFLPQQEMNAAFVQQNLPPSLDASAEGIRNPRIGLQQGGMNLLMQQQSNVPPSQSQLQTQQVPTTTSKTPISHTTTQQLPQTSRIGGQQTVVNPVDLPESDLGLGDTVAETGVEDDDLATLDLDPDKGDDDLGNLDNLETNDPHLDDLLNSDEFDLLAYTDPELDQGDPKDVFSDQLRLVEAEGEGPGSSANVEIKVEEKPKVHIASKDTHTTATQPPLKTESSSTSTPKVESSDAIRLSSVKLEDKGLIEQQQSGQAPVKDDNQPETATASLNTVRLGGIPFPLPSQSFPPTAPHPDLGGDPLGLPDAGHHSTADDLDKVESSLEASELPLLIQDLLEHEKKELQKQQQQQQLGTLQGGIVSQLHSIQNQQQPAQGTNQIMMPQHHHPSQGIVPQAGMVPRPPHMLPQQQQRLIGAAVPSPPHAAMGQQQGVLRGVQPGRIHPGLTPQQQTATPTHIVKQQNLASNFFPDKDLNISFRFRSVFVPLLNNLLVDISMELLTSVLQQVSLLAQRLTSAPGNEDSQAQLAPGSSKEGECSNQVQTRPNPPQFGIINDAEQHQYEEWLVHTQQLLQMQLKFLEEQIGAHRKSRKALCAKQRTAKKAGREFAEADAEKLKLVTEEQSKIQKQLDQVRKQQKEHTNLIAEYRSKQQQHQQGSSILAPGPSTQAPHMLSKMPGQMIMGQQGGPIIGQPPGGMPQVGVPQGGMPVRMPQMQPFGGAQPSLPLGAGTVQPVPPPVFFQQAPGAQGPDPRVIQERQLQQRMQMVQKMQQQQQQQLMMGQQPMPHQPQQPGIMNQQPGAMGNQPTQVLVGNMGQQQPNLQQGLINNQQNLQGSMQTTPGMMGNQAIGQTQHNVLGQPMTQTVNMMAGHPQGMVGNQQIVQQLQRPGGQHVVRGPTAQLVSQQQSVMAQRTLMSQQQQNASKNLAQLQQQQISQLKQPTQVGPSEPQRALETPPSGSTQGVAENLQQGVQDLPNPDRKDGGLLSPKTPPQQGGPPTPLQMQQQGSSGEQKCGVGQPQQPHAFLGQQQTAQPQSNQNIGVAEQRGFVGNQQAGSHLKVQPQQQQIQLGLQTQNTIQIKQEDQQMCFMAQQQAGRIAAQQPQDMLGQNSSQTQTTMAVITNQHQQALLTQQMGIPRGQQMMMTPRPGAPAGQIRAPINIQAFIAQNPQLRHLTPSQQLQHIQAMIAQRQLQQGQMLRMQGQAQGQMRPQVPQGPPVGPRMPGLETQQQQHRFALAGKLGPAGTQQQSGAMGQLPGMAPQFHQGVSGAMQQPSQGPLPQYINSTQQQQMLQQQQVLQHQMMRGQVPRPVMAQVRATAPGHMARPMSPRQLVGPGSPGSPLSNQQRLMRMSQTPPGSQHLQQQQPHVATALSPFQASPSHAGSPAGSSVPEPGSSPASAHKPEPGTLSFSSHLSSPSRPDSVVGKSSPFSQIGGSIASPMRSPAAKTQSPNTETLSAPFPLNGPSPQLAQNPHRATTAAQVSDGHMSQPTQLPSEITLQNIKQEPREVQCDTGGSVEAHSDGIKREISGETVSATTIANCAIPGSRNQAGDLGSQIQRTETGQQLLQKLLRTKNLQMASQRPSDGIHNEINGHINSKLAMLEQKLQGTPRNMEDLQSLTKRTPIVKAKRTTKAGERGPNSRKKTKKEEVGKTEAIMKQLKQGLSLLPLMEPSITASLDLFAPFGSSPANAKAQLKGSFGNAILDNIPDYYSQLLTKNNLSNPPTPPSSLPPTPPPSVQHKLLNGVTPVEELAEGQKEPEASEDTMGSVPEEVKSVDILAALPTPPHNQNEDIRMESDDDSDAPDSIVPASSPESQLGDETTRFPHLLDPKEEEDERAISPVIPIIPRSAIPSFPETKPFESVDGKVVASSSQWDKTKSNEVSVTFMLTSAAAKNINTVMLAVAQLLHIRMPSSYEAAFPQSPGRAGVGPGKVPDSSNPGMKADTSASQDAEWLKQFDVSLPGCTLRKQVDILALIKQECQEQEDRPAQHCYMTNVSDLDVRHLPVIPVEVSPPPSPSPPPPPSSAIAEPENITQPEPKPEPDAPVQTTSSPSASPSAPANTESIVKLESHTSPVTVESESQEPVVLPQAAPSEEQQPSAPATSPLLDSPTMEISLKPIKHRSRPLSDEEEERPKVKKWKGLRWKRLQIVITIRKGGSKKENSREVSELMERLRITLKPDKLPRDKRKCCFCHEEGDGATDGPARLLNIDVDLWVHLNCALWSTEVYETQGGALINVEVALRRGLRTRCAYCQKTGATNSCNRLRCPNVYHFACAIRARCMFFKDKTMLCTQHKLKGPSEEELSSFAVFRRVYIERDEVKQIASILQRGDRIHMFRVGGLIFHAVGQLLPSQMVVFHSPTAIFPVGYEATRIYWSTRVPNRRCRYRCRIGEQDGRPLFEVRVLEHGYEDLHFRDTTPDGIWSKIVQQVAKLRDEAAMLKLFTEHVKGEEMYGLTVHAVMRITESLPGVENCQNYTFRYGRHPLMELPLMINPTGCARSEPKVLTHCKRPHTLNSTSMSKAYQSTFTGEINTPYSKQFVHSKSSQYRRLKTEWKNNVYLARSRIQGLGLYAAKDLEKHTMVIEYIGTIIRNEVASRREKIYEEQVCTCQASNIYFFKRWVYFTQSTSLSLWDGKAGMSMAIAFSDKQGNLSSRFASIYILLSDDYNSEPVQLFLI
uniref:[histone H3]-lysine(4) N-methyltransferase n=1 Tax=Cyprinus carpio TaxID=7962 RepID=A0A8C2CGU6_CYPCA